MADLYGMLMDGVQMARAGANAKKKRGIADLLGQAVQAPREQRQSLLGQVAPLDPDTYFKAQKSFGEIDDTAHKELGRTAKMIISAPPEMRPQLWRQAHGKLTALGFSDMRPDWSDEALPLAEKLATMFSDVSESGMFSQKVDEDGFIWNTRKDGSIVNTGVKADRQMWLRDHPGMGYPELVGKDGGIRAVGRPLPANAPMPAPPTSGGGAVLRNAMPVDPQAVQSDYKALADQFGAQITSLQRSPEHNRAVGGVPGSQHLTGTGGDFVVPGAQKAAFMAAARSKGYEAIDEGDHIHLELPPGRSVAAPAPAMTTAQPRPAMTPAQEAANRRAEEAGRRADEAAGHARERDGVPAGYQRDGNGNLTYIKGGPADPEVIARNRPTAAANTSTAAIAAKVPQLQNAIRGIDRIESALKKLEGGLVNTGPLDQYLMRYTEKGQELEAAVGGIQNSFLALTRVPGIGSQSDLEARIAALQYPSLDKSPEVNKRTLENLKLFARDLAKAAALAVTQGAPGDADGDGVDDLLQKYGAK